MSYVKAFYGDDGSILEINQDYIKDSDVKYCITNGPSPYDKSMCDTFIDGCSFSHFSTFHAPVFIQDETGLTINMMQTGYSEIPLRLFLRFGNDPTEYTYEEYEWFRILKMPFDTEFFKVGHPYIVRLSRGTNGEFQYAILVSMTAEKMVFVYYKENKDVEEEDRNQINNLICTYEVTAERYKKMKKDYWFQAVSKFDKWGDKDD